MISNEITLEDIVSVRERRDGWEGCWNKIIVRLLGDNEDGPLYLRVFSICGDNPKARVSSGELISEVVSYYYERAAEGTLLTDFAADENAPEKSLIRYLCNNYYLRKLYKGCFRKSLGIKTTRKMAEENEFDQILTDGKEYLQQHEEAAPVRAVESREAFQRELSELSALFDRMTLDCAEPFSVIDRHAGLQLYPRLNPDAEKMERLKTFVREKVSARAPKAEEEAIRSEHAAVEKEYREEIAKIEDFLLDFYLHPLRKLKTSERLTEKRDEKYFQSIFIPLCAASIVRLTGIASNTADQHRSRYRDRLPSYLPDFNERYQRLKELREERGETILSRPLEEEE